MASKIELDLNRDKYATYVNKQKIKGLYVKGSLLYKDMIQYFPFLLSYDICGFLNTCHKKVVHAKQSDFFLVGLAL